jgi:hypothetical protein
MGTTSVHDLVLQRPPSKICVPYEEVVHRDNLVVIEHETTPLSLVPAQLRPVRDWMAYYERFWDEHLERLEKHKTRGTNDD